MIIHRWVLIFDDHILSCRDIVGVLSWVSKPIVSRRAGGVPAGVLRWLSCWWFWRSSLCWWPFFCRRCSRLGRWRTRRSARPISTSSTRCSPRTRTAFPAAGGSTSCFRRPRCGFRTSPAAVGRDWRCARKTSSRPTATTKPCASGISSRTARPTPGSTSKTCGPAKISATSAPARAIHTALLPLEAPSGMRATGKGRRAGLSGAATTARTADRSTGKTSRSAMRTTREW